MTSSHQLPGLLYNSTTARRELAVVHDCAACPPPHVDGVYTRCDCNAMRWTRANRTNIRSFSATCWFSGRSAIEQVDELASGAVPLGLIRSSWGGTNIAEWLPPSAISECNHLPPSPPALQSTPQQLSAALPPPPPPREELRGQHQQQQHPHQHEQQKHPPSSAALQTSRLWNGMVAPFQGTMFAFVVWYQGESNVGPSNPSTFIGAPYYACALRTLVTSWRERLQRTDLPFLVVELAGFCNGIGKGR